MVACVGVCVLVNPTLWGQNVSTKIAISKMFSVMDKFRGRVNVGGISYTVCTVQN